ncbi:hypothetical protein EC968_006440 [Mortierella alpina]|nr:hypothetical protein EC968_006440 [Mortierella alpina]
MLDSPVTGKLQPYYPPPPPVIPSSQHPRQQGHCSEIDSAQKKTAAGSPPLVENTMTTGALPKPPASRSRRHSSGATSLSIQTQHLNSIKRGPSTADVGATGAKFLEPETVAKGTARKHLRSILPSFKQTSSSPVSHLPPRQSPNHLVIPPPSRHQPPSQANQQYNSPSQHQQPQQQQHRQHQANQYQNERSQHQTQQHHHLQQQQQQQNRHHTSPGRSPNSSRATSPSRSIGLLESLQDRTAMALMQRYLSQPDDPDSEADITMQILISQAAVDAKGFEVLIPQTVESIKRHHATLSSRIAALTARLSLESKIREAAQSLLTLHADNKKLARQASDHLEAANRKVDQVATELWKLTQLAADLQRTLLQHTSGVLALGVVRLEDQARREREVHALQIQEVSAEQNLEEQFAVMSTTIQSLESDALEAQGLLEEKDRAIERLMTQLEHQRELFAKMDEQQQKAIVLSRLQQKTLDALGSNDSDVSKAVKEMGDFLVTVGKRLEHILQQQHQQQQQKHQRTQGSTDRRTDMQPMDSSGTTVAGDTGSRERVTQAWPSEATLVYKAHPPRQSQDSCALVRVRGDSVSSAPSDGDLTGTVTATVSEMTAVASKGPNTPPGSGTEFSSPPHYSIDRITSILDALESHVSESQQKMQVLEGELGLLRRHSVVLSASRNNSVRVKGTPPSSTRSQAEDTIRAALEKSLKDALLEKEMARQELENERQRWQDDQNHRISALEQSLVAVEDAEKNTALVADSSSGVGGAHSSTEETIQALRSQLREAIDEIDTLNNQQQASNKSMRQLFDLVPDPRRKNHMQLLMSHQHLQQQIANSNSSHSGAGGRGSPGRTSPYGQLSQISGRASPAGSISSLSSGSAVGFSMDALIARVKELVAHSQQLEQDNVQLRQQFGRSNSRSRQTSNQSLLVQPSTVTDPDSHEQQQDLPPEKMSVADDQSQQPQPPANSTWILNSELERLQASSGMIQLLEKELELLKQHTDMLLDENARLAELAAASATGVSTASSRGSTSEYGGLNGKPAADEASDLQEIIRIKDRLLQERDQLVREQDMALQRLQSQLADAAGSYGKNNGAESNAMPVMSSFDVAELEEFRIKCGKLEEQIGEMRMVIAALESVNGGPGSGSQLLRALSSSQSSPSPSWFSSGLGLGSAMGSLSFGSLTMKQQQTQPEATASGLSSPIPSNAEVFYNQQRSQEGPNGSIRSLTPSSANSSSINLAVGSGSSNAAVAGATAALRKEFRRVMAELREEKEKAVRKEVEERRRLERTVRQLRRELQAVQNSTHSS